MDEDKWIRDKAAQEDGAMANAGRLQPTSSQQAALEQAAREWLIANEYGCWRGDELLISPEDVRRLSLLLAAQRAAGLEEVLKEGEVWSFMRRVLSQGGDIQLDYQAGKYKGYEEYSARLDAAARERADQFIKEAQEQRP